MNNEMRAQLAQMPPTEMILQRESGRKKRDGTPIMLDYLPGWFVIDQLNAVFGADCWDMSVDRLDGDGEFYTALVTLTVSIGDTPVQRQDVGVGIAKKGNAMSQETAVKSAITDAMKRAARTFGSAFGNELYRPLTMRESGANARRAQITELPRQPAEPPKPPSQAKWRMKGADAQVYGMGGAVKAYVRKRDDGSFEVAATANEKRIEQADGVFPDAAQAKAHAERMYEELAGDEFPPKADHSDWR